MLQRYRNIINFCVLGIELVEGGYHKVKYGIIIGYHKVTKERSKASTVLSRRAYLAFSSHMSRTYLSYRLWLSGVVQEQLPGLSVQWLVYLVQAVAVREIE